MKSLYETKKKMDSKIQIVKYLLVLIFLIQQVTLCLGNDDNIQYIPESSNENTKNEKERDSVKHDIKLQDSQGYKVIEEEENLENPDVNNKQILTSKKTLNAVNISSTTTNPPHQNQSENENHLPALNTGALFRAIYVIIGLSLIVMAYMIFRGFRLSKPRTQMVRKYGVLANRQDVEMRPLPLDEDEDDESTLFDATTVIVHRSDP